MDEVILSNKYLSIIANEKKQGGASDEYTITILGSDDAAVANILFQTGPIKENGVNGCQQEDLLEIVLHRLRCFQEGDYANVYTEVAIERIEEALESLSSRTKDREKRGVEGTSEN